MTRWAVLRGDVLALAPALVVVVVVVVVVVPDDVASAHGMVVSGVGWTLFRMVVRRAGGCCCSWWPPWLGGGGGGVMVASFWIWIPVEGLLRVAFGTARLEWGSVMGGGGVSVGSTSPRERAQMGR